MAGGRGSLCQDSQEGYRILRESLILNFEYFLALADETGILLLLRKVMPGKEHPFKPEEWPTIVKKAAALMGDNKLTNIARSSHA